MRLASRWFALLAVVALTQPSVLLAQPAPRTKVLTLYAHDPNAPGVVAFAQGLREVVRAESPEPVEFYDENLDLDRFPDRARGPQLADDLADKFRGVAFDAIVAEGAWSLRFALEHLRAHYPDVPIVYGLAFEPVVDFSSLPPNVTGRHHLLPFVGTLALARRLQPDAERVVLVGGASHMDSLLLSVAERDLAPLMDGLPLRVMQDWSYESLIDSLRHTPPRSIVLFSAFSRDQLGREFNSGDLVASVTRIATAPAYGIARNWVGDGVVGGSVMDFGDDGTRTGRLLLQVLGRAPGEALPPSEVAESVLVVDWRQLQRWGLSEANLPEETEVLFREPSLWERFRIYLMAGFGIFATQSLLIGLLLLERSRRRRAQAAVEEQVVFERLMTQLTTDLAAHAPYREHDALVAALARLASFARASTAALTLEPDASTRGAVRLSWSSSLESPTGDPRPAADATALVQESRAEIPLISDGVTIGRLELRSASGDGWPERLLDRLAAAVELIAAAVARGRAAAALARSRDQLAHIARVASVGELAAAVSHELRQPLTSIRAHAEAGAYLLSKDPPDVSEAREAFQDIVNDDLRAAEIIDHIRLLLRKEGLAAAPVDVNEVCQRAARLLERDAALHGTRLHLSLAPELPLVNGDPVQLQQVIVNLTLNAIDAVKEVARQREVIMGTAAGAGHVQIFVRDNGPGLSDEVQRNLFEPFFSTKAQGLGMGLAVVRTIVERHLGRVDAENAAPGGAQFLVHLPVLDASPEVA